MALPHALSEKDSMWDSQIGPSHLPQLPSTLPRSFQHSSLLRRRLAEQEQYQQAGDASHASAHRPRSIATDPPTIGASSVRMSMPVDMDDLMDFSDDMSAALSSGMICGALGGSDDSMLQALLSSLPEPPASRPDAARMDSLIELADSLPAPPTASGPPSLNASQQHLPPPLSPPTSPKLHTVSKLDLPISPFCSTFTQNTTPMLGNVASSSTLAKTVAPAAISGQTTNRFPEAVNTKFAAVSGMAFPENDISSNGKALISKQDEDDDDDDEKTPTTARHPLRVDGVDSWGLACHSRSSSSDELTAVRPPSLALYGPGLSELTEITNFSSSLETPAPSRRNTDEVSLTQHHKEQLQRMPSIESLQSAHSRSSTTSSAADALLDGEMPPISPFFSRISNDEVVQVSETVKMAGILHRNASVTLGRTSLENVSQGLLQRGTWCSPSTRPVHDLLQKPANSSKTRASLAGPLGRWSAILPSSSAEEAEHSVDELQRMPEAVAPSSVSSTESNGEWIGNQKPPMSPMFTKASLDDLKAAASPADAEAKSHPQKSRLFQVEVFSSPFLQASTAGPSLPKVVVREISNGRLSEVMDAADDPDVQLALRHHPWVLHQLRRCSMKAAESGAKQTAMRMPTRLRTHTLCTSRRCIRPVLSFTASSSRAVRSDKCVRAINVESMVEAYLPRVHKALMDIELESSQCPDVDAAQDAEPGSDCCFVNTECTPSESSAVTMVGRSVYAESFQSASSEDTLQTPAHSQPQVQAQVPAALSKPIVPSNNTGIRLPISSIRKPARRSDIVHGSKLESTALAPGAPRQLRASASIANLRNSFHDRDSALLGRAPEKPLGSQPFNQIRSPRSLLPVPASRRRSEVEALINQANAVLNSGLRRSSAVDPSHTAPTRGIRPPRASFPLSFGNSSEARSLRSSIVSPRTSAIGALNPRISLMSEPEQPISRISSPVSGIRTPASLTAALSRQHYKLESARGDSGAAAGNEVSPLTLTPVRSLNAELFASSKSTGSVRGTVSASGLRPPSTIALSGGTVSRIPLSGAAATPTPTPTMRGQRHQRPSGNGGGGLANARSSVVVSPPFGATGQMSGIRLPPATSRLRHVASSNTLRGSGYGQRSAYGARNYAESSDSDEYTHAPARYLAQSGSNSSLYGKPRRLGVQGMFKPDDEFLTLRPVHTPDIVPRTIDPSLVERAMTPMLKTNAGILHSSIADMLRNSASIDMQTNMASMIANITDDSDIEDYDHCPARKSLQSQSQSPVGTVNALSTLPETSPAEEQTQPPRQSHMSHMSPLASPQGSPVIESDAGAKTPSRNSFSGRFGRPSFLTRSKAKSTSSGSMVSGIPIPSFSSLMSSGTKISTPKQAPATARNSLSGRSDTSSVRKARSLWALRGFGSK